MSQPLSFYSGPEYSMARRRIDELDARIAAAQRMKRYLQASVDCAARTPSECDCPAYPLIALGLGQGE